MALTVVVNGNDTPRSFHPNAGHVSVAAVTFDNSYTTNGLALTAGQLACGRLDFVLAHPASGYVFEYDYTNAKLKAYRQTNPAAAGGADIALVEVANGVDLSAVTTRVLAVGSF